MLNLVLDLAVAAASLFDQSAAIEVRSSHEPTLQAIEGPQGYSNPYRIGAVEEDTGSQLEIVLERNALGWAAKAWTLRGDVISRTTDTECPGLRAALEEFSEFVPLKLGPWPLQTLPPPEAIPPGWLGPSWTVRTAGVAPDWSSFDVEVRGGTGAYSRWAYETARAVRACDVKPT